MTGRTLTKHLLRPLRLLPLLPCFHRLVPPRTQEETPISQKTAEGRLHACVAAHRRLRPDVGIAKQFTTDAMAFLRSPKIVKHFKLKPSREKDKRWATCHSSLDLATALLLQCPELPYNARGRLKLLAYLSLLLFAVARPADLVLGQGRREPQYSLQYKDESFFFSVDKKTGNVVLAIEVTLRNLKGKKDSQDDWITVILTSRPHVPFAADVVKLLAVMAIQDDGFEDITSLDQLDPTYFDPADIDKMMNRFNLGTIKEDKLDLNVFRAINGSGAGQKWVTSPTEPATASSFRRLLYKVRTFCPPPLRLPSWRHGRNAPRQRRQQGRRSAASRPPTRLHGHPPILLPAQLLRRYHGSADARR